MKVVFISNLFPDQKESYRGLDNATLLHELSNEMEIRVIALRPRLPWKRSANRQCRNMDAVFAPKYLDYFYVPRFGSPFNDHLVAAAIKGPLQELKQQFDFDLILVAWSFPDACAVARLAPGLDVPFVTIVQGSDAHVYLKMPTRRRKIVRALSEASGSVTRSAKLATLLNAAGVPNSKLTPIYNGVDLTTFRPGNKTEFRSKLGLAEKPTILFVGNFLPVKNPRLLLEAHAELCRHDRAVQLVMVGGGPMENELRALVERLGTKGHVHFAGRKGAGEVADYMRAANLLCLSSENEGVPNVILEAFASGLPVVSTDVGGISEVLNKSFLGELVPRGDGKKLSAALERWLAKPDNSQEIRREGEFYSWPRAASEYKAEMLKALR